MQKPILISGSLAFDRILNFEGRFSDHILPGKIHDLNVSFWTPSLAEHFGGTAGNIGYNLALLGLPSILLSSVGNDFAEYRLRLEKEGVDLTLLRTTKDLRSAFATIMTDSHDNQITAFYPGAMQLQCDAADADIPEAPLAIVAAGNLEDMRRLVSLYRSRHVPYIFDPGQQTVALGAEDIKNCIAGAKVFISNDYELAMVMEKTGWTEEEILVQAEMIVTTLGEKGSRIRTRQETVDIPPAKVSEVKDPTGAGDAYRAGFILGLLRGWPLAAAGRFAGVISAYAIEALGTQSHSFTLEEAKERYEASFAEPLPEL